MPERIKERIEEALARFPKPEGGLVKRSARDGNSGALLSDIYVWQTVCRVAADELKDAWKNAQANGLIPTDDDLRDLGEGQHIVTESRRFSCIAEVKKAQRRFSLEKFIEAIVRKYAKHGATLSELAGLAELSKADDGTKPLSKKVLEV